MAQNGVSLYPVKQTVIFLSILMCATNAVAADNPFTGKYENQIAFHLGQGIDSGFLVPPPARPVPFYMLHVQYSQPTTFFRIPARQSLNIGQTIGFGSKYGWRWDQYSIPMVFISEDIVIFSGKKWYYANGAGVGLQAQQNERLGAKLLFQWKMIGGYKLNDRTNIELFMQHFSNANTARENYSYAFYGLGITYNI